MKNYLLFLLLFSLQTFSVASPPRCIEEPSSATLLGNLVDKLIYYKLQNGMNRTQAESFCASLDMKLFTIESQWEAQVFTWLIFYGRLQNKLMWTSAVREHSPRCTSTYWESTYQELNAELFGKLEEFGFADNNQQYVNYGYIPTSERHDDKLVLTFGPASLNIDGAICQKNNKEEVTTKPPKIPTTTTKLTTTTKIPTTTTTIPTTTTKLTTTTPAPCRPGPTPTSMTYLGFVERTCKTYLLQETKLSWNEAFNYCEKMGMKLATVEHSSEGELLATVLGQNRFEERFWISAERTVKADGSTSEVWKSNGSTRFHGISGSLSSGRPPYVHYGAAYAGNGRVSIDYTERSQTEPKEFICQQVTN